MKQIVILALIAFVASATVIDAGYMENIASEINSNPSSTWTAGVNERFVGKQMEDIKYLLGVKEIPFYLKPILDLPESEEEPLTDLPTNFDSRQQWSNCTYITEVRDQSNCGSCWAFGAAEAMTDRYCVYSGKNVSISSEDILSCCGFSCGSGCNGGYPSGAWKFMKNKGVVTGGLYNDTKWCRPYSLKPCNHHVPGPYDPCSGSSRTPSCKKSCIPEYTTKSYKDDKIKLKKTYSLGSVSKIMSDMFQYGPVESSFTVYEDFLTYKSGVYVHQTGAALGGHAIKCLGWGVENGNEYWLCANSWNESWGDNGYFKILKGKNHCGIESGVVAGTY